MSLLSFVKDVHTTYKLKGSENTVDDDIVLNNKTIVFKDGNDVLLFPAIITLNNSNKCSYYPSRNGKPITSEEFDRLVMSHKDENEIRIFGFVKSVESFGDRTTLSFYRDVLTPHPNVDLVSRKYFPVAPMFVKYNISFLTPLLRQLDVFGNLFHWGFDFANREVNVFKFEPLYEDQSTEK